MFVINLAISLVLSPIIPLSKEITINIHNFDKLLDVNHDLW